MFNWYKEADADKENAKPLPPMPSYLLQFFAYTHLPESLQNISKPFGELASMIATTLPQNPEATTALRKLLEAKDCAVRASIFKDSIPSLPSFDQAQKAFFEREAAKEEKNRRTL